MTKKKTASHSGPFGPKILGIDVVGERIIDYECDELNEQEEIELFQEIINSGVIWELGEDYIKRATELILADKCVSPPKYFCSREQQSIFRAVY